MRIFTRLIYVADGVAIAALFLLMLAGSSDGVSSLLLDRPIAGVAEGSALLMGVAIFAALPLTERSERHIKIDLFEAWIPHTMKVAVSYLAAAGGAAMVGTYAWGVSKLAMTSLANKEVTPGEIHVPVYPVKFLLAILLVLALLEYGGTAWRQYKASGRR